MTPEQKDSRSNNGSRSEQRSDSLEITSRGPSATAKGVYRERSRESAIRCTVRRTSSDGARSRSSLTSFDGRR